MGFKSVLEIRYMGQREGGGGQKKNFIFLKSIIAALNSVKL